MDIYTFTLASVAVFYALVKFQEHSVEQSLAKRWKLVNYVDGIIDDENYSKDFKRLLTSMVHHSTDVNFLPKMMFILFYKMVFKPREHKKELNAFNEKFLASNGSKEAYKKAFSILLEVNVFRAMHWYVVFGMIFSLSLFILIVFFTLNNILSKIFDTMSFITFQLNTPNDIIITR